MNLLKGKRFFYFVAGVGCAFFAGMFFVKVIKNMANFSTVEVAVAFLAAVCSVICLLLLTDTTNSIKRLDN